MNKELVTVDVIINYIKDNVENKVPLSPSVFVDAAAKLNVLLSDEHAILYKLQREVAQEKVNLIQEEHVTGTEAKMRVEAMPLYEEMMNQKAKISRIEEFIRIAKLQARMKQEEYKGG
jgi:phosphoglycerate-specific signal transduction histidine kinase